MTRDYSPEHEDGSHWVTNACAVDGYAGGIAGDSVGVAPHSETDTVFVDAT